VAHDAERHLGSLVQALSQDKRTFGFFLGAGCPTSVRVDVGGTTGPLIPAIAGLTNDVAAILATGASAKPFATIVSQLQSDGLANPTVEDILSRTRGLIQVVGAGDARGLSKKELDDLDTAVSNAIAGRVNRQLPSGANGYSRVGTWLASTTRTYPVEIFTTNYDLLIEQALEANKVPYFDGFVGSDRAFFDLHSIEEEEMPKRWVRLWKLHGSLNWEFNKGEVVRSSVSSPGGKRVIHPSHLKYDESRKMPYLAMMDRLRAFLKRPSATLITCGYSFSDQHINAAIVDSIRSNPTAVVFGLLYGPLSAYSTVTSLAAHRSNLCLFAEDAAVVSGKQAPWEDRQLASAPPSTAQLTWTPVASVAPSKFRPAFRLGDFDVLGTLCADVAGMSA
jgi:hypothetical protein